MFVKFDDVFGRFFLIYRSFFGPFLTIEKKNTKSGEKKVSELPISHAEGIPTRLSQIVRMKKTPQRSAAFRPVEKDYPPGNKQFAPENAWLEY